MVVRETIIQTQVLEGVRKKELFPVRGDLAQFLANDFFSGAVRNGLLRPSDQRDIPECVNDILVSVLPVEGEEPLFSRMTAISSVPKEIAWKHITGEVPVDFWEDYHHMQFVKNLLEQSDNDAVQEYAQSIGETRIDLDVKLMDADETSMKLVGRRIATRYGVSENFIGSVQETNQEQFSFSLRGYDVFVVSGPSPTNKYIDLIKISLFDPKTKQEIYHIDVSKSGRIGDKRSGTTMQKQDTCVADLSNEGGRLRYELAPEAIEVMLHQDSFDTETTDATRVLELALRGLRQNMLHLLHDTVRGVDYLRLVNGTSLLLPQFHMLFPLLRSDSLFEMRKEIRSALLRGSIRLPYENKRHIRLLQKELHVCLQRDPYMTIHALRDTGIALVIPGLRHLSDKDWDTLLRSEQFLMDISGTTRYARLNERTNDLIALQRETYLGRGRDKKRRYDGLERFMRALDPGTEHREWEAYLALWEDKEKSVVMEDKGFDTDTYPPDAKGVELNYDNNTYFLIKKNAHSVSQEEIVDLFGAMRRSRNELNAPNYNWEAYVNAALARIDGYSHVPWVAEAIARKNGQAVDMTNEVERSMDIKLSSIGLIAAMLQLAPSGLTPREMQAIYDGIVSGQLGNYLRFDEALYEMKLTGAVARMTVERIDRHGMPVFTDFYSWRDPHNKFDLTSNAAREIFPSYLAKVKEADYSRTEQLKVYVAAMNNLVRKTGICTIEQILAISAEDRKFITMSRTKGADIIELMQGAIREWYESLDEV